MSTAMAKVDGNEWDPPVEVTSRKEHAQHTQLPLPSAFHNPSHPGQVPNDYETWIYQCVPFQII